MFKNTMGLPSIATSNQSGEGGAAGLTDIAGLFANGVEGYWYDPSDSATVYESYTDESNNTPATFGGKIGYVKDKSGYANNLVQTDADQKPTYARQSKEGRRVITKYNNKVVSLDGVGMTSNFTTTYAKNTISKPFTSEFDAFRAIENSNNNVSAINLSGTSSTLVQGNTYTFQGYFKEYTGGGDANGMIMVVAGSTFVSLAFSDGATAITTGSDVSSHSATQVGSTGWWHVVITFTSATSALPLCLGAKNGSHTACADGSGFHFFGLCVENGSTANDLQVVGADEHDVIEHDDATKAYFYFRFDGSQKGLSVLSNLGSTIDSLTLFAATEVENNGADANIVEFSDNTDSGNQGYRLYVDDSGDEMQFQAKGTVSKTRAHSISSYPSTLLNTVVVDLSDDYVRLYKDGTLVASVDTDLGTGDFSASKDLNVGCRNADGSISNALKGNIYQLVGSGQKITNTSDLDSINTIVAAKAGLTV